MLLEEFDNERHSVIEPDRVHYEAKDEEDMR